MSVSEFLSPLIGRLVFGWFFLVQVVSYGGDWDHTVYQMMLAGIPSAAFLLALALLLVAMGSLSLIFGFHTRYGAVLLFAITIASTVLMHDYWKIVGDPAARHEEFRLFAANMAVAGGLLFLVGHGAGPVAVDNRGAKKK